MKNSDQKLFVVVAVLFFSLMCVNTTYTMIRAGGSALPSSGSATGATDGGAERTKRLSGLHVAVPGYSFYDLITVLLRPTPPTPIVTSPKSVPLPPKPSNRMRLSTSLPDFNGLPRSETPPVERRNSDPTPTPAHYNEDKKVPLAPQASWAKPPCTGIPNLTKFIAILCYKPLSLRTFLYKITPKSFATLLAYYGPELLFVMIHNQNILDAIDEALRLDTFMKPKSEPIAFMPKIPVKPIEEKEEDEEDKKLAFFHKSIAAESLNFDELVGNPGPGLVENPGKTALMLMAERGLTDLIAIVLSNRYTININCMNEDQQTAFDYAQEAYRVTVSTQKARGLTADQIISYRQEAIRLSECINFLRKNGALTGQEVLERAKLTRILAQAMENLQITPYTYMR